jgi:hypothetical protein
VKQMKVTLMTGETLDFTKTDPAVVCVYGRVTENGTLEVCVWIGTAGYAAERANSLRSHLAYGRAGHEAAL